MSIDLSLDRVRQLALLLPPYQRPTIHIAGTNGKGSVSALVSSILSSTQPPLRVGRFNSPHLVTIHDCISLEQRPVPPKLYDDVRQEVEKRNADEELHLTNFEILTITALQIFEREKVDVVVLEVGMGGRLDATNVIGDDTVLVSALTAVDLDHQAFLGHTVEKIAVEKAGIARPGKHFVLGRQEHTGVNQVVQDVVHQVGGELVPSLVLSPLSTSSDDRTLFGSAAEFRPPPGARYRASMKTLRDQVDVTLPLHGRHQADNLATALTIIDALRIDPKYQQIVTPQAIKEGVASVSWPGRLSFHSITLPNRQPLQVLVDGAHNAASARTLGTFINDLISKSSMTRSSSSPKPTLHLTYILSLSHSPAKPPVDTLSPILSLPDFGDQIELKIAVGVVPFSPPDGMSWVKAVELDELQRAIRELSPTMHIFRPSEGAMQKLHQGEATAALFDVLERASGIQREVASGEDTHLVVVAGSLYLVANFYQLLSIV